MSMKFSAVLILCFTIIVMLSGCSQATDTASSKLENPETASPQAPNTANSEVPNTAATSSEAAFSWKVASPEEQGVDEQLLGKVEEQLITNHTKIKSLLIVKNSHIVYEWYRNEAYRDNPTPVFSVTKSVMSALTGIAIDQGKLTGVEQKLSELLPEEMSRQSSSEKKEITIENALTMTGGLNSTDSNINAFFMSENYINHVLDQPMVDPSRSLFIYDTGLTHVLSGAITAAVEMPVKEYADENLFGPMAITNYRWLQDPQGIYSGGTNLYLTPRDMAKFGILYLHEGEWDNKQLIPKDWVKVSTEEQIKLEDNSGYGYLFWTTTMKDPQGKEIFTYEANGYGGQHVRVIPTLDSVIVVTSDETSQEQSNANELVENFIIPALG